MKLKDRLGIYGIILESLFNQLSLFLYEVSVFGIYPWFWKIKFYFWIYYFSDSPFTIVSRRKKTTKTHPDNLIYGETPFITIKHILDQTNPTSGLSFCDLGSGRGATVLFAALYFKMKSAGFELIPEYVDTANKIKRKLGLENADFINGDFSGYDIKEFDIIYFTPTTWDEENMEKLKNKLKEVKTGSSIISVSIKMDCDFLKETDKRVYPFSWGESFVYFYKKI
ncbi:MAG: methyltransferase domain-containing protein [Armatimonadota bacterium]